MRACSRPIAGMEIACEPSVTATITPVSCAGRKPFGETTYSTIVPTRLADATSSTKVCRRNAHPSVRRYPASERRNARSNCRAIQPGRSTERSSRPHIIGVNVSETTADTTTETASVTANSLNSRPTTPVMNSSGMNTAISDTVSETMVKPICAAPRYAARSGGTPCSM